MTGARTIDGPTSASLLRTLSSCGPFTGATHTERWDARVWRTQRRCVLADNQDPHSTAPSR